ncbi:hypothetical protein E3N88_10119 [Mikania micrantha]|uniref:Uncharacterized protein n=1 Tax=Mikania micrantha TaxID=192012 RepID=A0A5N6PAT2_9ASTR|nr:hypothetical protein E3N88_10119 [Mikania micrantha]
MLIISYCFELNCRTHQLCADVSNLKLFAVNLCAYDIGSSKSPLTSETSLLCFRNRFSDSRQEVTRGGDSDPSEALSAASQATPVGPRTPSSPRPVTPPPPPSPVLPSAVPILPSPPHSPLVHTSAERRQDSSPRRVPAWDGLRRMRGQARKTTGLPIRRQMAPRDEPQTIHEVGESSHQAEWRAQLQQVTQDLHGMRQDIQQQKVDTLAWRTSVKERLRRTWVRRIIATFWQQVELLRAGVVRVREFLIWLGMASFETKMIVLGVIMAAVAMVFSCLSYFLR